MSIIQPRSAWGARAPSGGYSWLPNNVGMALHWHGPTMGAYSQASVPGLLRGIQRYHMDSQGWTDIAYSFLVDRYGGAWEARGWNARTAANGSNAGNSSALAICYLGGEGDPFTAAAARAIQGIVAEHLARGGSADLTCHHDYVSTACPGPEIHAWRAAGGALNPGSTPVQEDDLTPEQAAQLAQIAAVVGNPQAIGGGDRTLYEAVLRFLALTERNVNTYVGQVGAALAVSVNQTNQRVDLLVATLQDVSRRLEGLTMGEGGVVASGPTAAEIADELAERLAS